MNSLVSDNHLSDSLFGLVKSAKNRIHVATAFCKQSRFQNFVEEVAPLNLSKKLIVRWKLSDLILGASDLLDLKFYESHGWEIYMHQGLHAKAYIIDDTAIVGSANLTQMGLPLAPKLGNRELAIITTDPHTVGAVDLWYKDILSGAIRVDSELHKFLCTELEMIDREEIKVSSKRLPAADATLQKKLDQRAITNNQFRLFTADFCWTSFQEFTQGSSLDSQTADIKHDIEVLKLNPPWDEEIIKSAFRQSRQANWLLAILGKELYFGAVTEKLHQILADDPQPYRKDVKILAHNLFTWAEASFEDIEVDQPNVSTRIIRQQGISDLRSLLQKISNLKIWIRGEEQAPHKPLLVLYALAELSRGNSIITYSDAEKALTRLLKKFGPKRTTDHPSDPFWRLQKDRIWEVTSDVPIEENKNGDVKTADLKRYNAVGTFSQSVKDVLMADPHNISTVAERLLNEYIQEYQHQAILSAVGLELQGAVD